MVIRSKLGSAEMLPLLPGTPYISYLVRTWFGDQAGWDALITRLGIPDEDGLMASADPLSDLRYADATPEEIARVVPPDSWPIFIADQVTLETAGFPVLVMSHNAEEKPFRVRISDLGVVTNSLPIGNLSWWDFDELDEQGVWIKFDR